MQIYLQLDSLITSFVIEREVETMKAPPKIEDFNIPLAQLYRWEGEDFGQNI
jgi:hypothetical protein